MSQNSKVTFLSIVILFTVTNPILSKPNTILNEETPAFVWNHLKLSAENYSNYQNYQQNNASGSFVSIGNDPLCTVDINIESIQDVIEGGATEIRLANNASYNEDLFISDKSITIRGGFTNCEAANQNDQQSTKTMISGTGNNPVIRISGSDDSYTINLENLDIRNGQGGDFFPGGGISTLDANAFITLNNVYLSNNTGNSGGGIAITSGDTDFTLIDTIVQSNQAVRGGGVFCTSSDASITILGESGILDNTATGEQSDGGGGIYLTDGCVATILSGSHTESNQFGISGNVAESSGGGVYLNEGAKLNLYGQEFCFMDACFGDSSKPVNISNNISHNHHIIDFYGRGGGIYAEGFNSNTQVYMNGVLINNNLADLGGGGIYAVGALLTINRTTKSCWDNIRCNYILANEVRNNDDDDTYGGGIAVKNATTVVHNTFFEENRADFGTALSLQGGSVHLSSSVINNNGDSGQGNFEDQYVIELSNATELTLEHVTIADNKAINTVFGRTDSNPITLNIYSSIIYDPNSGSIMDDFDDVDSIVRCVIAHEIASLQSLSGVQLLNEDPKFKAPLERDYHLDAMLSPAVDYCAQSDVLGDINDIDGQVRGWDDETIANNQNNPNFVFDAGADETYDNDIIFKNGLE